MSFSGEVVDFSPVPDSEIDFRECRFASYGENTYDPTRPDLHVIKEVIHTKSGEQIPNLKFIYDYQCPFWITRKGFRNHKQPKEWEDEAKLQKFQAARRHKVSRIANAVGEPYFRGPERKLFANPYIYGADISSTATIKKQYFVENNNKLSFFTYAEFDIETNLFSDREEATIASLFMPRRDGKGVSKLFTVVVRSFLEGFSDEMSAAQIRNLTKKYLGERRMEKDKEKEGEMKEVPSDLEFYNIEEEIVFVDNDLQLWQESMKKCHEWQPDLLSIWNMEFEMDKFEEMCNHYGVNPADIMSDPRVPQEHRFYSYKKGKSQKVTASGKVMPIPPHARWHTVKCPASFYIVDQMGVFRQTRTGEQEEPGYSLNAIMKKVTGREKLNVKEADHLAHASLDWHMFMQRMLKFEYIVYNRFDVIGPANIEEELKDLRMTLPMMADTSDFENFPSQPRRCVDDLHWYVQEEHQKVIGVTSDALSDDYTDEVLSLKDWIITLPASLIGENGLDIIAESGQLRTRIYAFVGDDKL